MRPITKYLFISLLILGCKEEKAGKLNNSSQEKSLDIYKDIPIKLVSTDIDNYWKAYDLYKKDSVNAVSIFKEHYFDKASSGLEDYFKKKIWSIENFVEGQQQRKQLYASIRSNTHKINEQKTDIISALVKFKDVYPKLTYPNVYFVIGNFTSAGTISDNGLLIGLDQIAKSKDIPLQELSFGQKNNFKNVSALPHIVLHELVHFQQAIDYDANTLLYMAIFEGMADFLSELFSGKTSNEYLKEFTKGKEQEIWNRFKDEMHGSDTSKWLANPNTATKEWPADLGYWIGYRICKSYYEEQEDKKKAINYMLNLPSSEIETFLKESKIENKITE